MDYMDEQLRRTGTPGPKVLGIDELSIGKGHKYRIVVSDLVRGRPIWFGGTDRSEKSMDLFFQWLGPRKCPGNPPGRHGHVEAVSQLHPQGGKRTQAKILYDKFHILKHLNEALDKIRKSEYARLSGKDRRFIKGQKYTLLSRANLSQEGRQSLKALFKANRRLNKAYLLKEMFSQLWDYKREVWAQTILRALEVGSEVAATQAVRFRADDRRALGRHRVVLPGGEQSAVGVRRRNQQQDPRHPKTSLWTSRRGIPPPQNPHLHAARNLKNGPKFTHTLCRRARIFRR